MKIPIIDFIIINEDYYRYLNFKVLPYEGVKKKRHKVHWQFIEEIY